MDRSQHQRYLTYLKKYEYFGRGRAKLDAEGFVALEAEMASLGRDDAAAAESRDRRREVLAMLLRD